MFRVNFDVSCIGMLSIQRVQDLVLTSLNSRNCCLQQKMALAPHTPLMEWDVSFLTFHQSSFVINQPYGVWTHRYHRSYSWSDLASFISFVMMTFLCNSRHSDVFLQVLTNHLEYDLVFVLNWILVIIEQITAETMVFNKLEDVWQWDAQLHSIQTLRIVLLQLQ